MSGSVFGVDCRFKPGRRAVSSAILVFLVIQTFAPVLGKRHKHAQVKAFFQGSCEHSICEQKCRDIDHGGYACECHRGYRLEHDGITCSMHDHTTEEHQPKILLGNEDKVKIIPLSDTNEHLVDKHHTPIHYNTVIDPIHEEVSFDRSYIHSISSLDKVVTDNSLVDNNNHIKRVPNKDIDVTINSDIKTENKEKGDALDSDQNVVIDDEKSSLESVEILTYDQTEDNLPAIETEELVSSETRKTDELKSLVPNHLPQYSSPSRESPEKKAERCDEFSCLNEGKCVDDGTDKRGKLRCDCPLGKLGEKCETDVEVRFPKFYGNSYMALPVLKTGYKQLDLLLEFRPLSLSGLLFFSAEFEDARSDFFSLTLVNGYLEFRYDCGTGVGVVRSTSRVAMDTWNTVRVSREETHASLWLNNDQPVSGSSEGSYSRLTLRLNMYLGGYDNLDLVKGKVGMTQGFTGCVEQVVVNGYKYDLRKADLVGDAQFGVNIGECSEGVCEDVVCEHSGQCRVNSADTHICLCPLGTGGENCQHIVDVHIPEFQSHSYIELPGLGRSALLFIEVEVVLKASKPDGLVLYNGYKLDRSGDFISLAIHNGYLEYRFDLGTGPAIIRSAKPIQLNKWHWVRFSRTGMEGILEVDGQVVSHGQSHGAFTQLTVTQPMYIGGHRNFDETSGAANVSRGFDGCIQKLTINKKHIPLVKHAVSGVNVESCVHPCVGQPCLNSGECMPHGDVYSCNCGIGYTGGSCHKKVSMSTESLMFSESSYLKYTKSDIAKRVGGDKIDIKFSIKPKSPSGVFFWSGQDIMEPNSDYVALGFKNEALEFRYNLGSGEAVISYNNSALFDGQWHHIHAQRDQQDGFLSIDGQEVVEGSSRGSYTMLNTNKILYIGGMPNTGGLTLKKFTSGFEGCIKDMTLSENFQLKLLSAADSGRDVIPCK
ncbi:pikachurin-like isoform X2 [Mya arenaria]|uniref:pikachurin-like isoform X2 n=1 Tax=Mya arenaria TaxID=6604 RepID=UPI0022E77B56|nr:pikachurin-like isoform X2 [Mya arenaria]